MQISDWSATKKFWKTSVPLELLCKKEGDRVRRFFDQFWGGWEEAKGSSKALKKTTKVEANVANF